MKKFAIILCFLFLPFGALMAQEVSVHAQLDTNNIVYVGEHFGYLIIIDGVSEAGTVDVSPLANFKAEYYEGKDNTRYPRREVHSSEKSIKQYLMLYRLLASKAGVIKLPSVKVTVNGADYKTNPVSVKVVKPERSDKLELEFLVSRKKCYVGEPVEISLKWYLNMDFLRKYEKVKRASFASPIFSSEAFYIERVINEPKALRDRRGFIAFGINGKDVPFAKRDVKRKGGDWIEVSYSAIFIPKHAGNVTMEPARVIAETPAKSSGASSRGKRFMVESKGAALEVIPLPDVARPKAAYGLVGNYTIAAGAAPTAIDVGQPITLTVKVGGSFLSPIQRPDLESMEGFAGAFKISTQRDDPVIKGVRKIFTITIRAANDSVTEIPSIPLVFFDTNKGKYVTAKTKPIPLKVSPSDIVTIEDAELSGKGTINSQVEAVKKGMAANVVDIDLVSQDFSPLTAIVSVGYLSLWSVPFAAFVVSVIVRLLTNTSDAKVAASRRRRARRNAVGMLKAAANKQDVAAAMREYIGWRFGKSSGALTGTDCERIIAETVDDSEIAKEYRVVFEAFEAGRYAGSGGEIDGGEIKDVISLIVLIDKKSGR
ncbi:MAG: protein BatD [Planctomycetes bacterium]|nr:protein BatD [Planctomycetota bacterium]